MNTSKRGATARFLALIASLSMIVSGLVAVMVASPASATPSNKITICHKTDAFSNPYVSPTVDMSSIDEANNWDWNGHAGGDHLGPVFDPTTMDQSSEWGDIIPPFTYTFTKKGKGPEDPDVEVTVNFPGYNWSAAGQAIYNNGCKPVEYEYSKQDTITKTICASGETITDATATGQKFSVTSYAPITQEQKDEVDGKAALSAEAAFDSKYPEYTDGACFTPETRTIYSCTGSMEQTQNPDGSWPAIPEGYALSTTELNCGNNPPCTENCEPVTPPCTENCGSTPETPEQPVQTQVVEEAVTAAPLPAVVAPAKAPAKKPAKAVLPAQVEGGVAYLPTKAVLPASVPAGEGSNGTPVLPILLIVAGALGALLTGGRILAARK